MTLKEDSDGWFASSPISLGWPPAAVEVGQAVESMLVVCRKSLNVESGTPVSGLLASLYRAKVADLMELVEEARGVGALGGQAADQLSLSAEVVRIPASHGYAVPDRITL